MSGVVIDLGAERLARAAGRAGMPSAPAATILAGGPAAWVRRELGRGPVRAADLAEAARQLGVTPKALRRALKQLGVTRSYTRGETLPGYSRRGVTRWAMPADGTNDAGAR